MKNFKDKYTGSGLILGLILGVIIGIMMDNIAIGIPIGLVFGIAIDNFYNTEKKKKRKSK